MKKILHIIASASGPYSTSTQMAEKALAGLEGEVMTLDLSQSYVPYVTGEVTMNLYGILPEEQMSEEGKKIKAQRMEYAKQLLSVDMVVISVPVWNFGVPAVLKAWIDLVGVMNVTWKLENRQYIGLATNVKNTIIVISAGGMGYVDGMMAEYNFVSPYLEKFAGFLGLGNYQLFAVEGTNMDKDNAPARIEETQAKLDAYMKGLG